jgi:hypothetical protein
MLYSIRDRQVNSPSGYYTFSKPPRNTVIVLCNINVRIYAYGFLYIQNGF